MSARARAERCFALARSTTFPAERATAVDRGVAIARSAGLDLDGFDIPGRPRAVSRSFVGTFEVAISGSAPNRYTSDDVADLMRAFRQHMGENGL